jgi:hypothetical protein
VQNLQKEHIPTEDEKITSTVVIDKLFSIVKIHTPTVGVLFSRNSVRIKENEIYCWKKLYFSFQPSTTVGVGENPK